MEESIIVAITAHPELYDVTCPLYKDRNKKEHAWVSISEATGIPSKLIHLHEFHLFYFSVADLSVEVSAGITAVWRCIYVILPVLFIQQLRK